MVMPVAHKASMNVDKMISNPGVDPGWGANKQRGK